MGKKQLIDFILFIPFCRHYEKPEIAYRVNCHNFLVPELAYSVTVVIFGPLNYGSVVIFAPLN